MAKNTKKRPGNRRRPTGTRGPPPSRSSRTPHRPNTAKRQVMVALLAVLAGWEKATDVHTWRHVSAWDTQIMAALITWGYQPAEVELLLIVEADD